MSVAIVKIYNDKIVLGADSIITNGDRQRKEKKAKIRKSTESISFACAGYLRETELFNVYCKSHTPTRNDYESIIDFFYEFSGWLKKKIDDSSVNNQYIFVYDNKAYSFYDYNVEVIEDYYCIGAGEDFAYASMYYGKTVEESIKCACELSIYCELPCNIIEIKL
jgi:ATP-dependent protease HslVU (ClpYQ) peptidase subunit